VKKTMLVLSAFLLIYGACAQENSGNTTLQSSDSPDILEEVNEDKLDDITPWTLEPEPPSAECIECKMYFCPPLDSIWQKEICMNICEDPPTLYSETECTEYFECDPTQYLIEQVECVTDDGYPGTQDKVCNKGRIQYTNCISDCQEESCNYEDDDCDGEIDEDN